MFIIYHLIKVMILIFITDDVDLLSFTKGT